MGGLKLFNIVSKFSRKLVKKFGEEECDKYALYPIIILSSPKPWNEYPKLDFPGDDSIEKFVNEELSNIF